MIQKLLKPLSWAKRFIGNSELDKNAYYDALTENIISRTLKDDSVCVDVGCFEADILLMMMKHAPRGKFYAFEPLPHLYRKLETRFAGNANVKLFNVALSNESGSSTFHHVTTNPGYSGLLKRRYDRPNEQVEEITVNTGILENFIAADDHVDLVKIDVEGAELQVLQGAAKIISRDKPVIIFEHGLGAADIYETKPEDVYDLLHDMCGLELSLLDEWLDEQKPLTREKFKQQFYTGQNYYFLAHPPK